MPSSISREGALSKWTNIINGWQFRWFVLDAETGLLSYFTTKENKSKGERRGCIRLKEAYVGYDNEDDVTFTITVDDKTFHLQALNPEDREEWVSKIERAIRIHSNKSSNNPNHRSSELLSASERKSHHHFNRHGHFRGYHGATSDDNQHHSLSDHPPYDDDEYPYLSDMSFKNFDSSLAESDAYLQLLIEQLKGLEEKRSQMLSERNGNLKDANSSASSSSNESPNQSLIQATGVASTSKSSSTTTLATPNPSHSTTNGASRLAESLLEDTTLSNNQSKQSTTNEIASINANLNHTSLSTNPASANTASSATITTSTSTSQMSNTFKSNDDQQHANNTSNENDKNNQINDEEKLSSLISSTQSLIETMKHAIVCLQIAKANSDPTNGLHTSDELKAILTSFTEKYTSITSDTSSSGNTNIATASVATGSKEFTVARVSDRLQTNSMSSSGGGRSSVLSSSSSNLTGIKIEEAKLKTDDPGKEMLKTGVKSEALGAKSQDSIGMARFEDPSLNGAMPQFKYANKKNPKKLSNAVPMASYSSSDEESDQTSTNASSIRPKSKKEIKQLDNGTGEQPQEKFYENSNDEDEADDDDDDDENYKNDEDNDSFYDAETGGETNIHYSFRNSIDSSPETNSSTFTHQKISYQASLKLTGDSSLPNEQNISTSSLTTTVAASIDIKNSVIDKQSTSITDNPGLAMTSELKGVQAPKSIAGPLAINKATSNLKNSFVDLDFFNEEEEYQEEELDINNQQSVITHLLTQVRIGMDLTKITLPTFILERRSLLEMYADFFAHTDLFLEIPSIKNPRDRMIQVVKWYLSTFHAGRKSPVAKKPYNPILGEVFQCWYDIPNGADNSNADNTLVTDGPIPWATRNQLTFIAEQVSHHPPISAFYAEHFNKRVQLDGYTWTKSKFLGLSIGVTMVGKAVLSLLDYDEEYVATFPSAYGRSILTVPWFEMGGPVSVVCSKTGYQANIEFLTKPFYGGKKHQISGTISQGSDKRPVCTIEGQWNGPMNIKFEKCSPELLLNPVVMPTFNKKLRPLSEQNDFESRKLWREVTYHLRTKQIDLATSAKQRIEQKQRDELKERKEKGVKWQTRYFEEQGENWIYVKPLIQRLQQAEQATPTSNA